MEEVKRLIRECCLEKEEAFCTSACPFHLDVREFAARMQRGSFNAAFRTFAGAVGFPAIVAALCDEPCKGACPRGKIDAPVELRQLERAALDYATNKKPNNYNLPKKNARVAIVGAGIGGLACALRLANKKYNVTVFERSDRIGGHLWGCLDLDVFLADIEGQFTYENYDLVLNREIENLDELLIEEKFDAVYVATGAGGNDFGLLGGTIDGVPFASARPGVFLGGSLTGASTMEAIAQGLRAATLVERYLKTESMKSAEPLGETKIPFDPDAFVPAERVQPSEGGFYTKEEAVAEAARCVRCQCNACWRHCEMISHFQKFPKRIEEEVEATVHPGTIDGDGTVATRLISTCNQCGLCAEVCPCEIDVGRLMRGAHRAMHGKGTMPWAYHEFWLRDMAHANGKRAAFTILPKEYEKCGYMFFPGCQIGASDPRYVTESYQFLMGKRPDTAIVAHCCGAPAIWAGDEPLFGEVREEILSEWRRLGEPRAIFACPTCKEMFEEYMPEIKGDLLFDVMIAWGVAPPRVGEGSVVSVFDPCTSRHASASQKNVRDLVQAAGFEIEPLPYEGEHARCCTFGGQIDIAAPNYTKWLVNERVTAGGAPYVTYCANCRDIFADTGKRTYHILDILLGLNGCERRPPGASERRENRERLRREMTGMPEKKEDRIFTMDEAVKKKIDASRLIESDILAVIARCEHEGRKIRDPESGHFFGHGEAGHHTLWVEYIAEDNGAYRLFNAYSHRMKIETGG